MVLGRTLTTTIDGIDARLVVVDANIGSGLPGMSVVGLGDTAVRESRYRLRTAVMNSGLEWPRTKIVVSLAPADLPKRGSHLDLAICLAVLAAHSPRASQRLKRTVVLGEVGLDGSVRRVNGVVPSALTAARHGIDTVLIPTDCAGDVELVSKVKVLTVDSLSAAWEWANGERDLPEVTRSGGQHTTSEADFADICGQPEAKVAAEIAAAGKHHLFLVGPPGSGKSMIAERLPSIVPELPIVQRLEVAAIRSVTGQDLMKNGVPFCAPHHTVTRAGLIGGGAGVPSPGAVTLAHRGVLFLDEVSEIPAPVLDSLRTPLERHEVIHSRGHRKTIFPANFQLFLAANPCRCGAETTAACTCTPTQRRQYLSNLSGPLLDRIDLRVQTTGADATLLSTNSESSAVIAQRVAEARERSSYRWEDMGIDARANGEVPGGFLRRYSPADDAGMAMLSAFLARGELSQRGVDRALRVSWTLADLDGKPRPDLDHVARAVELRGAQLSRAAA